MRGGRFATAGLAVVAGVPVTIAGVTVLRQLVAAPGWSMIAAALLAIAAAGMALRPLVVRTGDVPIAALGASALLLPAAATSWATARLLHAGPVAQLAWMLGEEDNAHVVGVAREILEGGPSGAELAAQYGTSFATPGIALVELGLAGPAAADPRLAAITATTAATALLPLLLGTAVVMAALAVGAGLGAARPGGAPPGRGGRALGALVGGLTLGGVLQLLTVGLPMQLGFATLAWAITWVVVVWAAVLGLTAEGLPRTTRAVLVLQLILAAVLVEGSWPFLAGAAALPIMVVIAGPARDVLRRGWSPTIGTAVGAAIVTAGAVALLVGSGAVRTVLSFGRTAFTAGVEVGSSIIEVGPGPIGAAVLATALAIGGVARHRILAVRVGAATLGAAGTVLAVWLAALAVADGITGYGGSKLMLATVVLAVAGTAAVAGGGRAPRVGPPVAAAIAALVLLDPLGRTALDWWDRTTPAAPPHAVATVTALEGSSPGLPIRCRPAPGTPATAASRLAAYFCIVWMEDAFNVGPESGDRFAFFQTEAPTFDDVVRAAEAEGLYGFAFPLRLGPGWFGWDGTS